MRGTKHAKKRATSALPPHANAAVHEAIMKRLAKMSAEEIFETAVKSGIYTRKGKLRKPYASNGSHAR